MSSGVSVKSHMIKKEHDHVYVYVHTGSLKK